MPLKHSTSLKEFSTTPSVSKMLMKDGNNVSDPSSTEQPPKAPTTAPRKTTKKEAPKEDDDMFVMD